MTNRALGRLIRRNRTTIALATIVALASSGTAAAASYLVLSTSNTASSTTTLKSAVNGKVLQITNTNSTGGTSAAGLGISVPAGRAPITVNSSAGKATNLNADKLDGFNSTAFIRGPVEAWREVGTAGEPVFNGGDWGNVAGFNTVAFMRDPLGFVHLKGVAEFVSGFVIADTCAGGYEIFRLPAGYRPGARVVVATVENDSPARIDIYPDGTVQTCDPLTVKGGMGFSLDGVTFWAAQ